jgi:hypothetical protein
MQNAMYSPAPARRATRGVRLPRAEGPACPPPPHTGSRERKEGEVEKKKMKKK